jgi:hypothetical protein
MNVTHQIDVAVEEGAASFTHGGTEGWRLGLRWTGFGRADRIVAVPRPGREAELRADRASYHREDGSEEWYESSRNGVEQGFVIPAPPAGPRDAALTLEVSVEGDLSPVLAPGGAAVALADTRGATVANYTDLSARDADGKALRAWFEVAGGAVRLRVDDVGARYPLAIDPIVWTFQQEVTASDNAAGDWFGYAVAVSGSLAVVGAPNHTVAGKAGAGVAYVFVQSGTTWTQQQELNAGDDTA